VAEVFTHVNYMTILKFNCDVVNAWYCFVQVTKLCDLGAEDSVCSVGWAQRGNYLAVGTNLGKVQVTQCLLIVKNDNTYYLMHSKYL
jgi:hypothetical protein